MLLVWLTTVSKYRLLCGIFEWSICLNYVSSLVSEENMETLFTTMKVHHLKKYLLFLNIFSLCCVTCEILVPQLWVKPMIPA